jgi:hypothetical protein
MLDMWGAFYTMVNDCDHGNAKNLQNTSKGRPMEVESHFCVGLGCEI